MIEAYSDNIIIVLLLSLRIIPVFVFAPPFTLIRVPPSVRVFLGLSLSLWLMLMYPDSVPAGGFEPAALLLMAGSELFVGLTITLTLQWAYAAILTVGRAVDIQTGYGLALLADPSLQGQMPLIGTVFAYGFAMMFFAVGGPQELLLIWASSIENLPVGGFIVDPDLGLLLGYISALFVIAVGLVAIILLTLFLIDLTVAFLSRTLPQMNVLLIGFQVKTIAVLLTVPIALSFSSTIFLRLLRTAFETAPELF